MSEGFYSGDEPERFFTEREKRVFKAQVAISYQIRVLNLIAAATDAQNSPPAQPPEDILERAQIAYIIQAALTAGRSVAHISAAETEDAWQTFLVTYGQPHNRQRRDEEIAYLRQKRDELAS